MFYDLRVPYNGNEKTSTVVSMLIKLGYDTVALEHTINGKPPPELVDLSQTKLTFTESTNALLKTRPKPFKVLNRLTVRLSDPKNAYFLNGTDRQVKAFDIVAVQPTTEKLFAACCEKLDIDVICLDFTNRLPFFIKPKQVNVAIERGIYFEIAYAPCIQDAMTRRSVLANGIQLVRASREKHVIISSQASTPHLVRGPYDVANLCRLFGLSQNNAKATVSSNCRLASLHGEMRKSTARGALKVELTKDISGDEEWKTKLLEVEPETAANFGSDVEDNDEDVDMTS